MVMHILSIINHISESYYTMGDWAHGLLGCFDDFGTCELNMKHRPGKLLSFSYLISLQSKECLDYIALCS